jgi:hypothetical protein
VLRQDICLYLRLEIRELSRFLELLQASESEKWRFISLVRGQEVSGAITAAKAEATTPFEYIENQSGTDFIDPGEISEIFT